MRGLASPAPTPAIRRRVTGQLALCLLLWTTTGSATPSAAPAPRPLPPGTQTHHVDAGPLGTLRYLAFRPDNAQPTHVLVLLHGLGGAPENWLLDTDVPARLVALTAQRKLPPCVVVVPQGDNGYWTDWVDGQHPWADWVTGPLLTDVARRFGVSASAGNTAIVGASMGGYGALSLALQRPGLFGMAVGLSPTDLVVATRKTPKRPAYTRVFGAPIQAAAVRRVNPLNLARGGAARRTQRFWIGWGGREPPKFQGSALARALRARKVRARTRVVPRRGHGWRSAWAPLHRWWLAGVAQSWRARASRRGRAAAKPTRRPQGKPKGARGRR